MAIVSQNNASTDYVVGYRFGMKHGLVSEAELRDAINRFPKCGRMGVAHRFSEGYFAALIDQGIWNPDCGNPAPWKDWKLPVH